MFLMALCASLFIASCKEAPSAPKTSMMKQVMKIHDDLMPKMGEMGMLIKELDAKADTTATGRKYEVAKQKLKNGYDGMMSWMQDFGGQFTTDEIIRGKELTPSKMKLLNKELLEVKDLEKLMLSGISEAKALLSK